jgi:hypothetical protein
VLLLLLLLMPRKLSVVVLLTRKSVATPHQRTTQTCGASAVKQAKKPKRMAANRSWTRQQRAPYANGRTISVSLRRQDLLLLLLLLVVLLVVLVLVLLLSLTHPVQCQ